MPKGKIRSPEGKRFLMSRRRKALTDRQKEILCFLEERRKLRKIPPTIREIAAAVGISSTGSVAADLQSLEDEGFISRDASYSRSIRLMSRNVASVREGIVAVPVLPLPSGNENFWEGNPEESLLLDKRIFKSRSLAAVSVSEVSGIFNMPAGKIFLVLEKIKPRPGEMCAFFLNDNLLAGPVYQSKLWWRFFDIFSGDKLVISRNDLKAKVLGRVAAIITAYNQ